VKITNNDLITKLEGFEAMFNFLEYYIDLTGCTEDLLVILTGSKYIETDTPLDSAFWDYWVDVIENNNKLKQIISQESKIRTNDNECITKKEGFEAMLFTLEFYYKSTKDENIIHILEKNSFIDTKTQLKLSFWECWLNAIEKVKKGEWIPLQKFH